MADSELQPLAGLPLDEMLAVEVSPELQARVLRSGEVRACGAGHAETPAQPCEGPDGR